MQSGFNTGGGGGGRGGLPEYYTGAGGARSTGIGSTMNKHKASEPQFRSHLSNLFMDSSQSTLHQIQNPASLIGKRSLSEFQFHQQNLTNNQNMHLRSMKPRTTLPNNFHVSYNFQTLPEKKMIDDRLLELEKQLLDDNDDDEEGGDGVSGITKADSEWCDTIHNLISPTAQPASPLTCTKQALMEAASAISDGKPEPALEILTRLLTTPKQRSLLEMMTSALKSRVNPAPLKELFSDGHAASTQVLYELLPCFRLGFVAANMAILEATLTEETTYKVHVIDFDICQGAQYLHLLHALSTRQNGKPSVVKITTVGEERLRNAREKLTQAAKQLRVGLEFHVVSHPKLSELSREALGCEPDEPIAVNFAFKLYTMPDESVSTDNPRDELLRRVKSLAPRVVTLVEQELNTNTAPFVTRVSECCAYYGAMLDSVEAVAKDGGLDRVKAEEAVSRKVINSVACEGRDRVERCEVFGKWRARMGMAGFELSPMSQSLAESLKNRLSHPSFTVNELNGAVSFGWVNRTLTVASAWH